VDLNHELAQAVWGKSKRSASNSGNCVEVARLSQGRRAVRDSKNPAGPVLVFTPAEWGAFIEGVKGGEFG
jgi:hypothetical protein